MKAHTLIAALFLVAAFSGEASSKDKGEDSDFKPMLQSLNKACGGAIKATVSWEGVKKEDHPSDLGAIHCSAVFQVLEEMCASPKGREFAKKIENISCKYGSELALSMKDSTLSYQMVEDPVNDTTFVENWFKSQGSK